MGRNQYINSYIKDKYDRLGLLLPKGLKNDLMALCGDLNISANEYIKSLIVNDLQGGESVLFSNNDHGTLDKELLDKWQIPNKYRPMIEVASYSKDDGYFVRLKDGYINDTTGTRIIHVNKLSEMRLTINKSHKTNL